MSSVSKLDPWAELLDDQSIAEVGGEHTNDGIEYAKFLAMALLVRMEEANQSNYAFVFEYLQDIALIDCPEHPTKATLIQVKKLSRGQWTKAKLCRKESAIVQVETDMISSTDSDEDASESVPIKTASNKLEARSPLGKLYLCVEKLSKIVTTEGIFVSNAGNDLRGPKNLIPVHTKASLEILHDEDVEYIRKKLSAELNQTSLIHLPKLSVEHSTLIPASMRETVRGLLDKLLTDKYPTLPSVSGQLQEKLLAAFSACSGPAGSLTSLETVLAKKGFTGAAFGLLVQQFASMRSASTQLDNVIDGLKSEGMPARAADRLRSEASRLQILLVRAPQTKEVLLWDIAVKVARQVQEKNTYTPALNEIRNELLAQALARAHGPTSEREADALALLAIIYVDQELTSPDSQPSGKIK